MMFEAIAFNFKRKKRLSHMRQPLDFIGATNRIRTYDPLITNAYTTF